MAFCTILKLKLSKHIILKIEWFCAIYYKILFFVHGETSLADSSNDTDKKLKTSAKPGGVLPAKNSPAENDADTTPEMLLKKLDSKLLDLFAEDDKPKDLTDELDGKLTDLFAADEKVAEEPKIQKQKIEASPGEKAEPTSKDSKVPVKIHPREPAPEKPKPLPKIVAGALATQTVKPKPAEPAAQITEKKAAPVNLPPRMPAPEKLKPSANLFSGAEVVKTLQSKPAAPAIIKDDREPVDKESKKSVGSPVKNKYALLKLTAVGVVLVGGIFALFTFLRTPEPTRQIQPAAELKTQKIIKPSAKKPVSTETPPVVSTVQLQPKPEQIRPGAPFPETKSTQSVLSSVQPHPEVAQNKLDAPSATATADPLMPAKPKLSAAAEIKEASGREILTIKPQPHRSSYPYSIHNGSYRTLSHAREAIEIYRKMGLEAYWAVADLGKKGIWYRVFIGYYPNREAAESVIRAKNLKDIGPLETKYANLIGTYTSGDSIQSRRRLLLEKGYTPYVITDAAGNLNLYVGAYLTSKDVENFSAKLHADGISSRIVER